MKGVLALEDECREDDGIVDSAPLDPIAEQEVAQAVEQNPEDFEQQVSTDIDTMGQAVSTAEAMQEVRAAMEGYSTLHPHPAASKAVETALAGMLRQLDKHMPAPRFVAQEEMLGYPTQARMQQVAQENFAAIRDAFKRVWAKLVALFERIVAWFKHVWHRLTGQDKKLKAEADQLTEDLNKYRRNKRNVDATSSNVDARIAVRRQAATEDMSSEFVIHNPVISRWLFVGDAIPRPNELPRVFQHHSETVVGLLKSFGNMQREMVGYLDKLIGMVGKDEEGFRRLLEDAYRHAHSYETVGDVVRNSSMPGKVVREVQLPFANRVFYWSIGQSNEAEGSSTKRFSAALQRDEAEAEFPRADGGVRLPESVVAQLSAMINRHLDLRQREVVPQYSQYARLTHMQSEVKRLQNKYSDKNDSALIQAQLFAIMRLIHSISSVMQASYIALTGYDANVSHALMLYCSASLGDYHPDRRAPV